MKGVASDLVNSSKSRYGGASTAAAFLENFVEKDVKWAHIDIAGPANISGEGKGASGFGVQLLLNYLWKKSLNSKWYNTYISITVFIYIQFKKNPKI